MDLKRAIATRLDEHIATAQQMKDILPDMQQAVELVVETFRGEGKILLAGNGGSAADAQHWAAEWVIRLSHHLERPSMPAIALTTDTSVLTAGANDIGYENVFARQVEAFGQEGDLLIAITTSGNSGNLVLASEQAKKQGVKTLGILGSGGGKMAPLCDHAVVIPSSSTQVIQELQEFVGHLLCELSELELYDPDAT